MIEAGEPSTRDVTVRCVVRVVTPGILMVAPPEVPRNAERAQVKAALRRVFKKRGQGQYRGWVPTPSFAAARESYPSRELPQRCYKGANRG